MFEYVRYVLLGIAMVASLIAAFILWKMAQDVRKFDVWQEGFDEGFTQGKLAERSKQRVWADDESEGAEDEKEI